MEEAEKNFQKLGYFIWFATVFGPDGEKISIHKGTPYR